MTLTSHVANSIFKLIVRTVCRVDDSQWHRFPAAGPLIIVANHINFIEVPIMYTHLLPRRLTGLAKSENWDRPLTRWIFELWGGIPLRRGEADLAALRAGMEALEAGKILAVAPEGTRSGTGRLRQGLPGVAVLALKANSPILPAAYFGHEALWSNLKRLRRTDFHLRVGQPFMLEPGGKRVTKQVRQQMADEIMFRIAELLPAAYRGYYADLPRASTEYLRFLPADTPKPSDNL